MNMKVEIVRFRTTLYTHRLNLSEYLEKIRGTNFAQTKTAHQLLLIKEKVNTLLMELDDLDLTKIK
jgi:hypothetical protein